MLNKIVKFRYLILRDTVPDICISTNLIYNTTITNFTANTARNFTFAQSSLASTVPLNLTSPNIRVRYTFTDTYANETALNAQFSLVFMYYMPNATTLVF
jgi:hypothetical protein